MTIPHMAYPVIFPRNSIPTPQFCILAIYNVTVVSFRRFVNIVVVALKIFSCLKPAVAECTAFWM
jgi:hypothetical protein